VILRDRDDLSPADKRDILVSGPAEYYGIDLAGLAGHLGPGWSLSAPVAELAGMLPAAYDPRRGYAAQARP